MAAPVGLSIVAPGVRLRDAFVNTIARSRRKQALAGELVEARALLPGRDFDAALACLASVRERAKAQGNADALGEIADLARGLWWRAPRGSDVAVRADKLSQAANPDLGSRRRESRRPSHPPPPAGSRWLLIWSLVVVVAWLFVSLMIGTAATETEYFSRSFLIVSALLVVGGIAAAAWVVGALVIWLRRIGRMAGGGD
jgi:hypothetical protein